ncbi:MAG: hypothetical protein ABSB67_06860 [Bryobacteraceae bacterium]
MNTSWVVRVRTLLFPPADRDDQARDRSAYSRLTIPHSFKPQLSVVEAFVAAATAFLRIFLGCLLFAVWGTYTLAAWSTIQNLFLRVAAVFVMFLLFLLVVFSLMLAGAALARMLSPRRR